MIMACGRRLSRSCPTRRSRSASSLEFATRTVWPLSRARRSTSAISCPKKYWVISDATRPIDRVRPFRSDWAPTFGTYWTVAMADSTRWRVTGLTFLVPFTTCETVAIETPAMRATSVIVPIEPFCTSVCGQQHSPVGPAGLEPATHGLKVHCSTNLATGPSRQFSLVRAPRLRRRAHGTLLHGEPEGLRSGARGNCSNGGSSCIGITGSGFTAGVREGSHPVITYDLKGLESWGIRLISVAVRDPSG